MRGGGSPSTPGGAPGGDSSTCRCQKIEPSPVIASDRLLDMVAHGLDAFHLLPARPFCRFGGFQAWRTKVPRAVASVVPSADATAVRVRVRSCTDSTSASTGPRTTRPERALEVDLEPARERTSRLVVQDK